jgi:dipeptidyl-peptidase III
MPWAPSTASRACAASRPTPSTSSSRAGESGPITPIGINLPNDQAIREHARQQVGVAVERQRGVRQVHAARVPARVRVERRGGGARREVEQPGRRADDRPARGDRPRLGPRVAAAERRHPQAFLKEQYSASRRRAPTWWRCTSSPTRSWRARPARRRRSGRDRRGRVRGLHAQRARAAAAGARGHADRRRPHAQPPDDRPLADGELGGDRGPARDGKTYYVMVDAAAFREGVGRLLAEVQRIKSEGDYEAAKALVRDLRRALRSGAARRGRGARRAAEHAVLHRLRAAEADAGARDDGTIADVEISYPLDLTAQMLEYSGRR